jgi:tetratricopeptide (TPR) repeat protein
LEIALLCLEIREKIDSKLDLSLTFRLIGAIYLLKGEYDLALQYCKQSLSIKEISKGIRLNVLELLSNIYFVKGEMNRTLKYKQRVVLLAEDLNFTNHLIRNLNDLGFYYRIIGKNNLAIEHIKRSLTLSEKQDLIYSIARSLQLLILIYIDEKSRETANKYYSRLTELYDRTKEKGDVDISNWYLVSKVYMMKNSARMRDRVEAQAIFKELIDHTDERYFLMFCLSHLCYLLLEELSLNNDLEIFGEIVPLITSGLEMAESTTNYYWLAEMKFLQAKLALIQIDIEEAKKLMVQAQRIADFHGLNLLASNISSEHDKLLDQVDVWNTIKKDGAPLAKRIKLASTSSILDRIQGRRAVDPPDLVGEEPILLLITDNSGATYFNYPFIANWDHSDLFSSFMSAFNTFSSEIFSKSIDRIRIGENTILINPVEPFLACYVIKGQSYPALQKLTRFTGAIKDNSEIWQALNKSAKTGEMLELDKPAALKTVINEIFAQ